MPAPPTIDSRMHAVNLLLGICAIALLAVSTGCYYDVEADLYPDAIPCDTA